MRIGEDFDKIEFEMFGLELLEPSGFIGDLLIFIVAIVLAIKVGRLNRIEPFFKYWKLFFVVFGVGFLFGGFGHLFYNYWGVLGKNPAWYLGLVSTLLVEKAMISLHPSEKFKSTFNKVAYVKFVLALIAALYVSIFVDLTADYTVGLRVPSINTSVGLILALGYFCYLFMKEIRGFRFFIFGILTLIPVAVIQSMKLNPHQLFDRNDMSHILLITAIIFYYLGVKSYATYLSVKKQ
ncbi:MAG: hypothetical protein QNK23_01895 [Crocinitomicaceae bacterium]|nr:hypothetical protein [Crocinitomicaceae bacterium]